jgi:rhodanese-related sulfurtransferase
MRLLSIMAFMAFQFTFLQAQTIHKILAEEAHAFLAKENTDSLIIIDGRSDEMFQSGHLKNAINIDAYKETLKEKLDTSVIHHKHLFIYCTKSTRSDSIITTLSLLGYKGEIIQMTDGMTGWKENNLNIGYLYAVRKRVKPLIK